jgi:glycosyltransferase involved in cell wall biosynthesis
MQILLTNSVLSGRSGTEIVVAQLADELRRRGHRTLLYSPRIGQLGLQLQRAGHQVFERIADIRTTPDIIHAHHLGPALAAFTAFPATPAVFLSHSVESEFDAMPRHPSMVRYMAVSDHIRPQRAKSWLPAEQIYLLRNAVDLRLFPDGRRLPTRPMTALAVVKYREGIEMIRLFCGRVGIRMDIIGDGVGAITDDLPARLRGADLVFATGRSALEALAAGCSVILTDGGRFGGLIGPDRIEALLNHNLGVYALPEVLTEAALHEALQRYDKDDAASVTAYVRQVSSLTRQADDLLKIYEIAVEQGVGAEDRTQLATLIEAYIPNHGELPWRRLVTDLLDDASLRKLNFLAHPFRFEAGEDHGDRSNIAERLITAERELAAIRQAARRRATAWLGRLWTKTLRR